MQIALFATTLALAVSQASATVGSTTIGGINPICCATAACVDAFGAHARVSITIGAAANVHYDVGVSPGLAITGQATTTLKSGGEYAIESSAFAAGVVAAHDKLAGGKKAIAALDTLMTLDIPAGLNIISSDLEAWKLDLATTTIPGALGGQTLEAGVYDTIGAFTLAGLLPLTLNGGASDKFTFITQTSLATAASTKVVLTGGAVAENVLWVLGTSASLGAGSELQGSILAGTSIALGATSTLRGCALAQTAVTIAAGVKIEPVFIPPPPPITPPTGINAACCSTDTECFAAHARTTITISGIAPKLYGDIGVSPGTAITGAYELLPIQIEDDNGSLVSSGSALVSPSAEFAATVVTKFNELIAGADAQPIAVEMGGETFTPGVYAASAAINIGAGAEVTLDGENNSTATFTFISQTTFVTGASSKIVLVNGALAENVIWVVGTGATLGASSEIQGSILSGTTVMFGASAKIHGCALSQTAITFGSDNSVGLF